MSQICRTCKTVLVTCSDCNGSGRSLTNGQKCIKCNGSGKLCHVHGYRHGN